MSPAIIRQQEATGKELSLSPEKFFLSYLNSWQSDINISVALAILFCMSAFAWNEVPQKIIPP